MNKFIDLLAQTGNYFFVCNSIELLGGHNVNKSTCQKTSFLSTFCLPYSLWFTHNLVGTSGLEPPTSRLSGVRSNHLSYAPIVSLREPFEIITFEKRVSQFRRSETANYFFQQTARLSGVVISAYLLFLNPCVQSLVLVEMRRIELLTPCVQGRCSPSWATPPYQGLGCQLLCEVPLRR